MIIHEQSLPVHLDWRATLEVPEFECTCYLYNQLEFIVPHGGTLLKRLEQSGDRLHHIAFKVDDIVSECKALRNLYELEFLLAEPVRGVGNTLVNFVLPKDRGVMVELVQCLS